MEFNTSSYPYILKGKSKNKIGFLQSGTQINIAEMEQIKQNKSKPIKLLDSQIKTALENKTIEYVWFKNDEKEKLDGKAIFQKQNQKTYVINPFSEYKIIGWYRRGRISDIKISEKQGELNGIRYDKRIFTLKQIIYYFRNQQVLIENNVDFTKI